MTIRDINIVYGVGKEPYVEVSFNDGDLINVLQEQIGLNELTAYITRFEQQAFIANEYLNFDKSQFEINGTLYDSISITSNSGNPTPPPGSAVNNFVFSNGSNVGTIDVIGINGTGINVKSGGGYNDPNPSGIYPITNGESAMGDLANTPIVQGTLGGTITIEFDASGLSSPNDISLWAFGSDVQVTNATVDNGTGQTIAVDANVLYGGSLFVLLVVGAQPAGTVPTPPLRAGVLSLQSLRSHYIFNSVDQVKLPNSGITYPVANQVQQGLWTNNTANTIDVNVDNLSVVASAAVMYLLVNGVNVDQKIVPKGTNVTVTLQNVPNPIPNGQPVRIAIIGV